MTTTSVFGREVERLSRDVKTAESGAEIEGVIIKVGSGTSREMLASTEIEAEISGKLAERVSVAEGRSRGLVTKSKLVMIAVCRLVTVCETNINEDVSSARGEDKVTKDKSVLMTVIEDVTVADTIASDS